MTVDGKGAWIIGLALAAAMAGRAAGQEEKVSGLPDRPLAREDLAPAAWEAYRAPLEATVTRHAMHASDAPKQSFVSGTSHYHNLNAMNHEHGGFEPMAFRPKFRARATAWDLVALDADHAQALAEGFYDGARVRVYQAVDGKLVKIRDGIVPKGGHHATGWLASRSQVSVLKGKTDLQIQLDGSFVAHRDYWFCVKAVDKLYQFSESSNVVQARSGEAKGQVSPEPGPPWQRFDEQTAEKPAPPPAPKNLTVTQDGDLLQFRWNPVESAHLVGYNLFVSTVPPERHKGFGLMLSSRDPAPDRMIQKNDIVFVDQLKTALNASDVSPYVNWPARRDIGSPFKGVFFQEPYKLWSDGSDGYPATWAFVPHPGPVPEDFVGRGATCLKWSVEGDALTGFPITPYAGRKDTWYPALAPGEYTVDAWVRGAGRAQLVFCGGPFAPKGVAMPYKQQAHPANTLDIPPVELPLTEQWTKVTRAFHVPSYVEEGLGFLMLSFQGPGTLYLDNLRIRRAGEPYGLYPALTRQRINESHMRFMRTHELIKTTWGYTLEGMTGAAGGNNYSAGHSHTHTFFSLLENMREAGNISPWLQVEMCLSEEEWLGFAEWLCAPYDPARGDTPAKKPQAFKRWSMGQKKPWIEEFPEFAFEISNETWNQSFKPYDWDWGLSLTDGATGRRYSYGAAYGLFNEYVIGLLRTSPYWTKETEAKTRFMLCGWTAALPFGADAARHSPSADEVTYAAYVHNSGLGDPKAMNDFKRFYVMQWPLSAIAPHFAKARDGERRLRGEGRAVESGVYEFGYAYFVMPGDPPAAKEADQQLARGMIGAVAILDGSLTNLRLGMRDQAFFTFGHQIGAWGSHTALAFGGHAYPFWKALTLYNLHGTGAYLETRMDRVPRWNFPEYEAMDNMNKVKRPALPAAPLVSVHAFARADCVTVFLISRKLDGFPVAGDDGHTPAAVKLPFDRAGKITLYKLAGDPRTDDRFEESHKVETVALPADAFRGVLAVDETTGADARGLPPASIFCYVFEGANTGKLSHPPVAGFDLPREIVAGEPITLKNLSVDTDGDALSYTWKLGALGESTNREPMLNFAEAGIEAIELTATDAAGLADTLVRLEQVVALRFGGALWRPRPLPSRAAANVRGAIDEAGRLVVRGRGPIVGHGTYNVLVTDPRYRKDFVFEAEIAGIECPAGDAKACGGLVLVSELNEGLGFGWDDYKAFLTPASLLIYPNGAVCVLRGAGEETRELLPAGSLAFPVRVRMDVRRGRAVASVFAGGAWKTVAEFGNLGDYGLLPGVAAGSGGGDAGVTISRLAMGEQDDPERGGKDR